MQSKLLQQAKLFQSADLQEVPLWFL